MFLVKAWDAHVQKSLRADISEGSIRFAGKTCGKEGGSSNPARGADFDQNPSKNEMISKQQLGAGLAHLEFGNHQKNGYNELKMAPGACTLTCPRGSEHGIGPAPRLPAHGNYTTPGKKKSPWESDVWPFSFPRSAGLAEGAVGRRGTDAIFAPAQHSRGRFKIPQAALCGRSSYKLLFPTGATTSYSPVSHKFPEPNSDSKTFIPHSIHGKNFHVCVLHRPRAPGQYVQFDSSLHPPHRREKCRDVNSDRIGFELLCHLCCRSESCSAIPAFATIRSTPRVLPTLARKNFRCCVTVQQGPGTFRGYTSDHASTRGNFPPALPPAIVHKNQSPLMVRYSCPPHFAQIPGSHQGVSFASAEMPRSKQPRFPYTLYTLSCGVHVHPMSHSPTFHCRTPVIPTSALSRRRPPRQCSAFSRNASSVPAPCSHKNVAGDLRHIQNRLSQNPLAGSPKRRFPHSQEPASLLRSTELPPVFFNSPLSAFFLVQTLSASAPPGFSAASFNPPACFLAAVRLAHNSYTAILRRLSTAYPVCFRTLTDPAPLPPSSSRASHAVSQRSNRIFHFAVKLSFSSAHGSSPSQILRTCTFSYTPLARNRRKMGGAGVYYHAL